MKKNLSRFSTNQSVIKILSSSIVLGVVVVFTSCQGQSKFSKEIMKSSSKSSQVVMPSGIENPERVYFVTFLYYNEGGAAQLNSFMEKAQPYWDKYKLGNVGVIKIGMKRAVEGANDIAQPDEIRLNFAEDMALFQEYTQEPAIAEIDHIRAGAIKRLSFILGKEQDIKEMKTLFETPVEDRTYFVQLLHFYEDGEKEWRSFNQKAAPLFKKYGLHFDYMFAPLKKVDAKGDGSDLEMPDKIVIFHADDIAQLKAYNADPNYLKIAPIRAKGVKDNKIFAGKLIAY